MKPMTPIFGLPQNGQALPKRVAERLVRPVAMGGRLALSGSAGTVLLLTSLHLSSPEFAPSWRMVSEYAYGRYGWVLSLMFLAWGISSWGLAVALWPHAKTRAGRVGLWLLIVAGLGEAMAAVFDIRHDAEHTLAGLLGVGAFPIAALVLTVSLGRLQVWRGATGLLLCLANLSWMSVVFLVATLMLMTVQFLQVHGGELPSQAPTSLPPGVIGLDGWADRSIILVDCLWIFVAAWLVRRRFQVGAQLSQEVQQREFLGRVETDQPCDELGSSSRAARR